MTGYLRSRARFGGIMINKEELNKLVEDNIKDLYKYCLERSGGDEDIAEKAVSDVFLSLSEKRKKLRAGPRFKAYLYRTADNRLKRLFSERAETAKRELPLEALNYIDGEGNAAVDSYFKDERDDAELLSSAAKLLPEKLSTLFRLRFIEKKSYREISEETGIPASTVRLRVMKAAKLTEKNIERIVR